MEHRGVSLNHSAMTSIQSNPEVLDAVGVLTVVTLAHPQGCRGYLLVDPSSRQAMAIDVHLDLVDDAADHVQKNLSLIHI